jgi:hypothetical protein
MSETCAATARRISRSRTPSSVVDPSPRTVRGVAVRDGWLFLPSAASIPKIAGQFDVMATIFHVIDENHDAEGKVAADLERSPR